MNYRYCKILYVLFDTVPSVFRNVVFVPSVPITMFSSGTAEHILDTAYESQSHPSAVAVLSFPESIKVTIHCWVDSDRFPVAN